MMAAEKKGCEVDLRGVVCELHDTYGTISCAKYGKDSKSLVYFERKTFLRVDLTPSKSLHNDLKVNDKVSFECELSKNLSPNHQWRRTAKLVWTSDIKPCIFEFTETSLILILKEIVLERGCVSIHDLRDCAEKIVKEKDFNIGDIFLTERYLKILMATRPDIFCFINNGFIVCKPPPIFDLASNMIIKETDSYLRCRTGIIGSLERMTPTG